MLDITSNDVIKYTNIITSPQAAKKAAVSQHDMLHFYIAVIRLVSEYAVPVWHTGLTADLSDQLETTQERALLIIFGGSSFTHHSYESLCYDLEILPLSACRDQLASHFFHKILHPTSCLHHLLPPKRHNHQTAKLRRTVVCDIPFARTIM